MFDLEDTGDVAVKATVIEGRSKKTDKKDEKVKEGKMNGKDKGKSEKGRVTKGKEFV